MATKKLQVLANLGPTDAKIKSTVEDYFTTHPIDSTIIDKLCPAFTENGSAVKCEPVEGYPLRVVTTLPASEVGYSKISLVRCGKNLYDAVSYSLRDSRYIMRHDSNGNGGELMNSNNFAATETYIPVSGLAGATITLNHCPADVSGENTNAGMAFYTADKVFIEGTSTATMVVPENAVYMRFSVPKAYISGDDIQIELGSEITSHEDYRGDTFVVDFGRTVMGGSFNWQTGTLVDESGDATQLAAQTVDALSGINTLYGDGEITVSGRADPVATFDKLTNAIIALGGNV